jgi:hypothetical protein
MQFWDRVSDARQLAEQGVEVWMPVHIAPTRYFVSNLGNMMSDVAGRGLKPLTPVLQASGRPSVGIYVNPGDRKSDTWLTYRLMLWAFDGPPPTEQHTDACHGREGESDNRLCNLRWGTRQENMQDVVKHKRAAVRDRVRTQKEPVRSWYGGQVLDEPLVYKGLALYNAIPP